MTRSIRSLVTLVLIAAMATAFSQGGGGRGGMRGFGAMGPTGLLQRQDVIQHLGLNADQQNKLEQQRQAMMEEMRAQFQNGGGGGDRAAMQQMMAERMKKSEEEAKSVLTEKQWTRLNELFIQREGNRIAANPKYQKELGLTQDQLAQINDAVANNRDQQQGLMESMRNGEMDRSEMQAQMQRNQAELTEKIGAVLTDEQKAMISKWGGEPFKFEEGNN